MKKKAILVTVLVLVSSPLLAKKVHDWHGLENAHQHIKEAMNEMNKARTANNYDMEGHGEKAEQALHEAEREIAMAIETIKSEK